MPEDLDVMKVALQVLTALSQKRDADPSDVAALVSYAGPRPEDMSMEEFACHVIQTASKARAAQRRRAEA